MKGQYKYINGLTAENCRKGIEQQRRYLAFYLAHYRANRAAIYQRKAEEEEKNRQKELEKELEEEKARKQAEEEATAKELEDGENKFKRRERITAKQFELLAAKYGVNLPIKLLGWLRSYCKGIEVVNNNIMTCYFPANHSSNSVYKYAWKLANIMGV